MTTGTEVDAERFKAGDHYVGCSGSSTMGTCSCVWRALGQLQERVIRLKKEAAMATVPNKLRTNPLTCRQAILKRLVDEEWPLAVHELGIWGHSENALATELSIMAKDELAWGTIRPGKKFKEWRLTGEGVVAANNV